MNNIKIHNIYKDQPHKVLERYKCVIPTYKYDYRDLTPEVTRMYETIWNQTTLVTVGSQPPITLTIGPIDWGNLL